MGLFAKAAILRRWSKFLDGWPSLYNAVRLTRTGRYGGDAGVDRARPLKIRGIPWTLWARPATDDLLVILELFDHGEYQSARQFLSNEPIRLVVDLGVNVGYATAFFAAMFPEARFVGVEPGKYNFAMAQRSLAPLIDQGRVVLHHGFVGAANRLAAIGRGGAKGSNELFLSDEPPRPEDEAAEVLTVGDLIGADPSEQIDLLKCDIEGGEREVFENCAKWIGRVRFIVIELHCGCTVPWLQESIRRNGGEFELLGIENRHGAPLAWLRRAPAPVT